MDPSFGLTVLIILGILIWSALLFVVAVVIWKDPRWQSPSGGGEGLRRSDQPTDPPNVSSRRSR